MWPVADIETPGEIIIPLAFIIFAFGTPTAIWIVRRTFDHHERMAMIRQGVIPPVAASGGRDWQACGPFGQLNERAYAPQALRRGVRLFFIGMALLIGLSFIGYEPGGAFGVGSIRPGPWLLGGLIPLFIGLAQIVNALLSGALAPADRPAPGQNASEQPAQAPFARPYTYRPGERSELQQPFQPPDKP